MARATNTRDIRESSKYICCDSFIRVSQESRDLVHVCQIFLFSRVLLSETDEVHLNSNDYILFVQVCSSKNIFL